MLSQKMCLDINPKLKVKKISEGITEENTFELLSKGKFPEPRFVLENIDLAGVPAKIALHKACREKKITIMTALMLGLGAILHVFHPNADDYDKLYITPEGKIDFPKLVPHLGSYIISEYMDACFQGRGHAPTCVIGATTAAGMMVSEVMRGILLGKEHMTSWPEYLYVDFFDHVYKKGKIAIPSNAPKP